MPTDDQEPARHARREKTGRSYRHGRRSRRQRRRPTTRAALWAFLLLLPVIAGALWLLLAPPTPSPRGADGAPKDEWHAVAAAGPPAKVSLPADDAPHDSLTEWWYYNGHLTTPDGHGYSFHYVVFLRKHLAMFSIVHASFADHAAGTRYDAQFRAAGNPSSGSQGGFDFRFGRWLMLGSNGHDRLRVSDEDFALDLRLEPGPPPVLHAGGLLDFAAAGKSYYYSRTRMPARGTVALGGTTEPVTGEVWFDHQWGEFRATLLGWDWFALQLEDGSDLMLYLLRDAQGKPLLRAGTLTRDGTSLGLGGEDFEVTSTGSWTSPKTGISYPQGWRLGLPGQSMAVTLDPVISDSEFDGRLTSFNVYWEGAVQVTGTHTGVGFVELGGYDTIPSVVSDTQGVGATGD